MHCCKERGNRAPLGNNGATVRNMRYVPGVMQLQGTPALPLYIKHGTRRGNGCRESNSLIAYSPPML